jgi:hypothetical protein
MRLAVLGASLALLASCATPSDVKQAIKAQSTAYDELDQSLQDFAAGYDALVATVVQANEVSRQQACALALAEHQPVDSSCGTLKPVPAAGGTSRRSKQLAEYSTFVTQLDQALAPPAAPDPLVTQALADGKDIDAIMAGWRRDGRALGVINATIADYYGIDLSPGPEATKAAIDSLKSLVK